MKIRPENYITDVPPVQDEVQTDQYHEEISMHAFASQPAILTQDDLQVRMDLDIRILRTNLIF